MGLIAKIEKRRNQLLRAAPSTVGSQNSMRVDEGEETDINSWNIPAIKTKARSVPWWTGGGKACFVTPDLRVRSREGEGKIN